MSPNGGDPCTYKKVDDDGNSANYQYGSSSSSYNSNISNTYDFTNQTSSSTSYNYSSSNKADSYNRSANDYGKSSR